MTKIDGLARRAPDALDLALEDLARLRVQRSERLVHQQHRGIAGERAGDGAALAHPAGELVRIAVVEAPQVNEAQELLASRGPRPELEPLELQRELDVAPEREPREERGVLEDDGAIGPGTRDGRVALEHAPGRRPREARHEVQDRRLAAARRPEQAHELPRRDAQGRAAQDLELALRGRDAQRDVLERDRRARARGRHHHDGAIRKRAAPASQPFVDANTRSL